MAAILQKHPRMYNVLPHDLESFVYALVVPVLQYQRHDITKKLLPEYFTSTFDGAAQTEDGLTCGGGRKTEHIRAGHPGWTLKAKNSPLATLIKKLYLLLQAQWASFEEIDREAILAHWGLPEDDSPDPKDYPIPDLVASRPMATHDSMDKIFKDALASEGWDDKGLEKTEDQFIGLFADRPALPHLVSTSGQWLSTHKRPHGSDTESVGVFKKRHRSTTSRTTHHKKPARTEVAVMDFPLSATVESDAENETDDVSCTDDDSDDDTYEETDEETGAIRVLNGIHAHASSGKGAGARR